MKPILPFLCIFFFFSCKDNGYIDNYNITWDTPSTNVNGSMPVGGGNIQLNAWCENNDILFYIGSTESFFNRSSILGKLGRVRLRFTPNPFEGSFKQELKLKESEVIFTGKNGFKLTLWVDVFNPVIHVEMSSEKPVQVQASYETWRLNTSFTKDDKVMFYHRNNHVIWELEEMIKDQKAESFRDQVLNPMSDLTSGGLMYAKELQIADMDSGIYMKTPYKAWHLRSEKMIKELDLRVAVRIEQDASIEKWEENVRELANTTSNSKVADREKSKAWWNSFWKRSYININPAIDVAQASLADVKTDSVSAAWQVGRNYQLFRYMMGCTRGAKYPAQFNGGIFNFDSNERTPDRRMWQDCEYMAQNQRLVYWPFIKTGDFDLMEPVVNLYNNMVPLQKTRAKTYWDIEGAAYPEGLSIYGLNRIYLHPDTMVDSWNRCEPRLRTEPGHSGLIHLEYHYTSMLDFAYMMLEHARFGGSKLTDQLPFIESAVKFFDNYYQKKTLEATGNPLDKNGKLVLYPSSALELYAGAKNPTDVVAGLHALVNGVLSFPESDMTAKQFEYFKSLQTRLPDVPVVTKDGRKVFPPAESWELEGDQENMEFPQMYTLFPFELYTFGDPQLEIAKNTWLYNSKASAQKNYICWFQGGIFTAHLGMTEEAKSYTLKKFLHPHALGCDDASPDMRFPSFWVNPGFDHYPDIDHGGTSMIGLHDMLMQTPGKKIYLLPAWPKSWDCNFKLNAPYNTIVECEYKNGKITKLIVTPESRKTDVVFMNN